MITVTKTSKTGGRVLKLNPFRVKPIAKQPRKRFFRIPQLAASIRKIGQVTPIVVIPSLDPEYDAELIDGERRLKACQALKIKIQAVMQSGMGAAERFAQSVAANFCRQNHDTMEIAESVDYLAQNGSSLDDIAEIFGKCKGWVVQTKSLLHLHPSVQKMLIQKTETRRHDRHHGGRLTRSLGLLLVPLPEDSQLSIAQRILKKKMGMAEAKRFILKIGLKKGYKLGKTLSPESHFNRLMGLIKKLRYPIGEYIDLRGADFNRIKCSLMKSQRKELSEIIEKLTDDLLQLSDALNS